MAIVHEVPQVQSRVSSLLTTDFCPWANRFVYWLKEPVGWFFLATAVSVIVGLYLNPIGWTLAASLVAIMTVGMLWPLIAVHVTNCGLRPEVEATHEDSPCRMIFSVRNRIPFPVWGLAIQGYLDTGWDFDGSEIPTVGLSCVPPLCTAEYRVTVKPQLRGFYPIEQPQVVCSFPFGIWTARRKLSSVKPLTIWPKVFDVQGVCPMIGKSNADQGDGQRGGRSGDFVGVRQFRRGDSAKHVHWIASARTDTLIVTERGGPQCVELDIWVDTSIENQGDAGHLSAALRRESLACRIRTAASVLLNLHQSSTPMRVTVGDSRLRIRHGAKGRRQILDALASVPLDGADCVRSTVTAAQNARIEFTGGKAGEVVGLISDPQGGRRAGGCTRIVRIKAARLLAEPLLGFWQECRDVDAAA